MKEIKVKIKNVYGNEMMYPDCEMSQLFCDVAGTKTLTVSLVALLKRKGYTVTTSK